MSIFWADIIAVMFCFAATGFFAGMETALTSLSTQNIRKLREKHPRFSGFLDVWEKTPSRVISMLLLGTNFAMIGVGVLMVSIGIFLVSRLGWNTALVVTVEPFVTAAITLAFCEIIPKVYSRYHPERVSVLGLPLLVAADAIFRLPNKVLLKISEGIIGFLGRRSSFEMTLIQPDELKVLLLSDESIPISKPARKMIKNIFDFGKTRVGHVMVPRTEINAVSLDQPPEAVVEQIIERGYSRVPVYRGNLDNIVGIIYSKDLSFAWRGGSLFLVEDLIRPAYFVPDSARLDKVLREFKSGHQHLAVVVNEFGSTVGLVTIEDIVEKIVGEIWDEYDVQERTVYPLPDGSFLVNAGESLERVNEDLHLQLPAGDFNTVSGWALDMFGRIPKPGDSIKWGNLQVEIADADKRKILKVKIKKLA